MRKLMVSVAFVVSLSSGLAFADKTRPVVTRKASEVAVEDKEVSHSAMTLVEHGKASYRVMDPDGVVWRVTVSPVKARNKDGALTDVSFTEGR